jgi:hypothetical protein
MKVLKAGRTAPKWVGRQVNCVSCGFVGELEENDAPHISAHPDYRNGEYLRMRCLTVGCGHTITWEV